MEKTVSQFDVLCYFAVQEKCRCQINNADLPDGMDSSWETAAALHHGSHVRFGCVEFVFSIINYTTDLKIRSYQQLRKSPSRARQPKEKAGRPPEVVPEVVPPPKKAKKADDEDLSSKLRSLLNVLSSAKSSPSRSSSSSAANLSPRSSPELSRSPSPLPSPRPPSDPSSLIEVNYEESDHVRHEIRTEDS